MHSIASYRLSSVARAAALLALLLAIGLGLPQFARADFTVHMPTVVKGEKEVEAAYTVTHDSDKALSNDQVYNASIGYSFTSWWEPELEFEWEKPNGEKMQLDEVSWENTFQLTEPGEHWVNVGIFAEYAWPQNSPDHTDIKAGPIFQIEGSRSLHTVNLFLEREVGVHAEDTVELTYAWQSRFRMLQSLDLGFEIFGEPGEVGKPLPYDQQQVLGGPVVYGEFKPSNGTSFKYEIGYLVGATKATPDSTWKVNVEFEF